jgi:hypothetical protein
MSIVPPLCGNDKPSSGPWSPRQLFHRALSDLTEHCELMASRNRSHAEILVSLAEEAQHWRSQGTDLPFDVPCRVLANVTGISVPPEIIADLQVKVRSAIGLGTWLYGHPLQPLTGLIVCASRALILVSNEVDKPCI